MMDFDISRITGLTIDRVAQNCDPETMDVKFLYISFENGLAVCVTPDLNMYELGISEKAQVFIPLD